MKEFRQVGKGLIMKHLKDERQNLEILKNVWMMEAVVVDMEIN